MQRPGNDDAHNNGLIYRFSGHSLDTSRLELRRGDTALAIERKPLELLICLLERPGEVVTKEELQDTVWPGRYLS
ncbi:MAG: winged helix-turn-helix domain-containing protein, partial [Oceanococcaceae bacterium]